MTGAASPTVAVCYDGGSAKPTEITRAVGDRVHLLFLLDRELSHVAEVASGLERFVDTLDTTGRSDEWVLDRLLQRGVGAAVTFSDTQLVRCATINSGLGGYGLAPEVARNLVDKPVQRQRLAGIDRVRNVVVSDAHGAGAALAKVGIPAVLKPVCGTGSLDVTMVHCADEVEAVRRRRGAVLVEELLRGDPTVAGVGWGDYVSVETAAVRGRLTHLGIHGKPALAPPFLETGCFLPATLSRTYARGVEELVSSALRCLGISDGLIHTEVKLTPAGPRIIEVNGRLGGAVADIFRLAGEPDPIDLAIRIALGVADPGSLRRADPGQVAFQLVVQPGRGGEVAQVSGWSEVRQLPGVRRVVAHARPGHVVRPRLGMFHASVGLVYGVARDHENLREIETEVHRLVSVRFADELAAQTVSRRSSGSVRDREAELSCSSRT